MAERQGISHADAVDDHVVMNDEGIGRDQCWSAHAKNVFEIHMLSEDSAAEATHVKADVTVNKRDYRALLHIARAHLRIGRFNHTCVVRNHQERRYVRHRVVHATQLLQSLADLGLAVEPNSRIQVLAISTTAHHTASVAKVKIFSRKQLARVREWGSPVPHAAAVHQSGNAGLEPHVCRTHFDPRIRRWKGDSCAPDAGVKVGVGVAADNAGVGWARPRIHGKGSAIGGGRVLAQSERQQHVVPGRKNLHLVNDRGQGTGAIADDAGAVPVEGQGRGVGDAYSVEGTEGVGREQEMEFRGVDAQAGQVLGLDYVIVVALIVAFEFCSGNFRTHVIHVHKHAGQGSKSCPAAADGGVANGF